MNGPLDVTLRGSEKPSYLHGPVPVVVTIANVSGTQLSIQLAYPVPEVLRFRCRNLDVGAPRPVSERTMAQSVPIAIAPGGSHTATYYLNRYFNFKAPGRAVIDWQVVVPVKQARSPTSSLEFHGSFPIELVTATDQQLRDELAQYSEALHSPKRQARNEAAEALAFLDTPLSAEYVVPMLGIEDLEIIGIHALGRNPSRRFDDRIVQMLSHRDSTVVGAALEEIDRHRINVDRSVIQHLLASGNPNIQWLALGWLAEHPSREDLRLLPPLVASPNQAVRERAQSYEKSLGGVK